MKNNIQVISSDAKVIDNVEEKPSIFDEPTENEKELVDFIIDHTDRWRDYRDQNFLDDWNKYERIFRGTWSAEDKLRDSERSRVISPATQQAIETSHAETMEAIFGQGEYFDIKDDLQDVNGTPLDIEKLKAQLYEDFAQDKIRKSIDQIGLLAKIYGTGIGEVTIGYKKVYKPAMQAISPTQAAYGSKEEERFYVQLNPINPKNFIFDPNGSSIDDCMGVAIERETSIHKIAQGIASKKYKNVDISAYYKDDSLEPTQESINFKDNKVTLLTYYGLVPKEYLAEKDDENVVDLFPDDIEDYADMVEAIVVIANGSILLKAEESPYTIKDRPVLSYQDDTVPNRLLGRGIAEKAMNMQMAIDGSMRSHMDSLALTTAPMVGLDATRLPRGAKFEIKPGKAFLFNGNPNEIVMPFKFGQTDGQAMETSREFERMLLMSTATIDSNGTTSQVSRDTNMDMATATLIKKYKRTLVNFQEDFLIPFIYKATWRYMQFNPERYPSLDVKFIPTATLGIIAREYEQKQLAFLIQTLGAQSPIAPVLMKGILSNSSLSKREEMIAQMDKMSQPDPQKQQMEQAQFQSQVELVKAQSNELNSKAQEHQANAQKTTVETELAPAEAKAKIMTSMSINLPNAADQAQTEFDRRVKVADLMLKEEEIASKKKIVEMQTAQTAAEHQSKQVEQAMKIDEHQMKKQEHEMKKQELELKKKAKKVKITSSSGETYTAE